MRRKSPRAYQFSEQRPLGPSAPATVSQWGTPRVPDLASALEPGDERAGCSLWSAGPGGRVSPPGCGRARQPHELLCPHPCPCLSRRVTLSGPLRRWECCSRSTVTPLPSWSSCWPLGLRVLWFQGSIVVRDRPWVGGETTTTQCNRHCMTALLPRAQHRSAGNHFHRPFCVM